MDLRPWLKTTSQVERAKELILRGLFSYQPFIFAEDLEVGAGYEFLHGEFGGLVYWPTANEEVGRLCSARSGFRGLCARLGSILCDQPGRPITPDPARLKRLIAKEDEKDAFRRANARLRVMYDSFISAICERVGDVTKTTFVDVGCNAGYFPVSFSLRGAKRAVGYDSGGPYADAVRFLNDALGTKAIYYQRGYDVSTQSIPECDTYDVVVSAAVLCHICDPLFHLRFLGSIARKALFIWTSVTEDDSYCIRFGEPNRYLKDSKFPLGFDNEVRPSLKLLRKSLELMGFKDIVEIPNREDGMPDSFYNLHRAVLALR